jgi:hypothetical protein
MVQGPSAGKTPAWVIALIVIVIVVVVVVAIIAAVLTSIPTSHADLRATLSYSVDADWFAGGGTITVSGTIYNYGDANGGGTVNLHIFDGYAWHDASAPTGVVPAGGQRYFEWSAYYNPIDENSIQVSHTITTG